MKALANIWYVYYFEDDEEDMTPENAPWDEFTLFIEPRNKDIEEGSTKVLMVQSHGFGGWMKVPNMSLFAAYNKPLPTESYRHFIRACFYEV